MRAAVFRLPIATSTIVFLAAAAACGRPHQNRVADGFTYPGRSAEAKRFNKRWDGYMRRLPAAKADPELDQIEWMRGSWTAQPRDFPDDMGDASGAELAPSTGATSDWTVGHRWLHISFVAEPWHAEWNYFLGHDPVVKRWVLQFVATPSILFEHPLTANAWSGDRLVFAEVGDSDKGFHEISRIVIVRNTKDMFRIVSEVKMPSGKFVAMDDVLFTRRSARR